MKTLLKEYDFFNLYEYQEGVYLIECEDRVDLGFLCLRLQEFYESPKYKGIYFDLVDLIYDYTKKSDNLSWNYCRDWEGYNIPDFVFRNIFGATFVRNQFDNLMYDVYNTILKRIGNKKWCCIGIQTGNEECLAHEISHCLYYLNKNYNKEMSALVKEIKVHTPNKYKFIVNDLKNTGYCDDVIEDEVISYISTNIVNEWKVNKKTVECMMPD